MKNWWDRLLVAAVLACLIVLPPTTVANAAAQGGGGVQRDSFIIVFDVSGSMNDPSATDPGISKIDVAKGALTEAIQQVPAGSANLGLLAFSGCAPSDSEVLSPPEPVDPEKLVDQINGLDAGGSTGIETALRDAVASFQNDGGNHTILLVSDGEETCGGDPCGAVKEIVVGGTKVVVNTIGFQTEGTPAEPQLQCIADASGGTASSVTDADELIDAILGTVVPCVGEVHVCFAPVLRFHPDESQFPLNPTDWLPSSELRWAADQGCNDPLAQAPSSEKYAKFGEVTAGNLLNFISYEHTRVIVIGFPPSTRCEPITNRLARASDFTAPRKNPKNGKRLVFPDGSELGSDEGFYLNYDGDVQSNKPSGREVSAPTYYFLAKDDQGRTIIHYWFFYGYDDKGSGIVDALVGHEGDWEHIVVTLGEFDRTMTRIEFHGHGCDPIVLDSADGSLASLETVKDTHPVVYVAKGSHASYPNGDKESLSGWPSACSLPVQGTTDVTGFNPSSKVLRTWESGLVDPRSEAWFGFGGLWGNNGAAGDRSGPTGPPWNMPISPSRWLPDRVAQQFIRPRVDYRVATAGVGMLQDPTEVAFDWGASGEFNFTDGTPNEPFVAVLGPFPTVIGRGALDEAGAATGVYTIPSGTPPGTHYLTIRSETSGLVLGSFPTWVNPDAACVTSEGSVDSDGDWLDDTCDPDLSDGPLADFDGDGVINRDDNCPTIANVDQAPSQSDAVGAVCNSVLGVNPVPSYPVRLPGAEPTPTPVVPTPTPVVITPTPVVPTTTPAPTPSAEPAGDYGPISPQILVCSPGAVAIDTNNDRVNDTCVDEGKKSAPIDDPKADLSADAKSAVGIGFTG